MSIRVPGNTEVLELPPPPPRRLRLGALLVGLLAQAEAVVLGRERDPRLWSTGHIVLIGSDRDRDQIEATLRTVPFTRTRLIEIRGRNELFSRPEAELVIELAVRPGAERVAVRAYRRLDRLRQRLSGASIEVVFEPVVMVIPAGLSEWSTGLMNWLGDVTLDASGGGAGDGVAVHILDTGVSSDVVPGVEPLGNYVSSSHERIEGYHTDEGVYLETVPGPHGTAVAALIRRFAPECRLSNTQVLDPQGLPVAATALMKALYEAPYIGSQGDRPRPMIVNASLRVPALEGTKLSTSWTDDLSQIALPLKHLHDAGIIVVAPNGNTTDTDITLDTLAYPARLNTTIAIGSCDPAGSPRPISRRGPKERKDDPYHWWMMPTPIAIISGADGIETSHAAAMASGLIARHLDPNSSATPLQQFEHAFDTPINATPQRGLGILTPRGM